VVNVPLRHRDRRTVLPARLYPDGESQLNAAVLQAMQVRQSGRPVLIGTGSVAASEALSRRLTAAGVPHTVLNARQDADEARVIAHAGERQQVTVATNMAGRGTDIALGAGVAALGGLHVICCQHSASRRIERQLVGRCARQGDPGSAQTLVALDGPLLARFVPRSIARRVSPCGFVSPRWLVRLLTRVPQVLEERRQRAQRRALLGQDMRAAQHFSFGRPFE
jgi:preprotein translocase subunit SecA